VSYRAVLFDLGGVVLGSPLRAIAAYECEAGLRPGVMGRLIEGGGESGAWARLDRGELDLAEFHREFERECRAAGLVVDSRALVERISRESEPRPLMLAAIARLRARGLRVAALTNDWAPEDGTGAGLAQSLGPHFDALFQSSRLGMRKPDPRIYLYACRELRVAPAQVVFLDDIGVNLKSARQLGMYTIKVVEPEPALAELAAVLGFPLDRD
jgi:putative hydrolase of the HAD superfamily